MIIKADMNRDTQSNLSITNYNNLKNMRNELKEQSGDESKTVFAGSVNIGTQEQIAARTQAAKKEALKTITDQFARDTKTDQSLEKLEDNKEIYNEQISQAQGEIEKIQEMKKALKEDYHISDDSEEQKDLELLEKSMKDPFNLSKEEMDQLSNMGELTDYQKGMLKLDSMEDEWSKRLESSKNTIMGISQSIESSKQERLKRAPMLENQKVAAEIMEAVKAEIKGMVIDTAKDHVDETMEENKENAEKTEEKKEEQQAKTENTKEDPVVDEKVQETAVKQDKLDKELEDIVKKNKILKEDLKGIVVDGMV